MPLYRYECPCCGFSMEHDCSMEKRSDTVTCRCGAQALQVLSAPNILVRADHEHEDRRMFLEKGPGLVSTLRKKVDHKERHRLRAMTRNRDRARFKRASSARKSDDDIRMVGELTARQYSDLVRRTGSSEAAMSEAKKHLRKLGQLYTD